MKIIPLTLRAANDFIEQHHRHSARTSNDGGKFAIGLENEGELVGAAIVGRPVARMLQQPGHAELLRCCVSPAAPRNASSKLDARCRRIWQMMGGTKLVTYNLKRESGASLRGAGFIEVKDVRVERWDRASRRRDARQIESEAKARWESDLPEIPA